MKAQIGLWLLLATTAAVSAQTIDKTYPAFNQMLKTYVVGIDMTDEQLEVANRHIDYHTEAFGYNKPNVEFRKGLIEKLDEAGLEDNSFDIVISNGVINLCPDKDSALREIYRVLKPGGEFFFSEVFERDADHRFEAGRSHLVCGKIFNMLAKTRFAEHFDYFGDESIHFGRMITCAPTHEADRLPAQTAAAKKRRL